MGDPDIGKLITENVVRRLKTYGPALVARFSVYPDFRSETQLVHRGSQFVSQKTNTAEGLHAMLLVGHRKTTSGEDRFLLQNWWAEKAFAEVDVAYLHKCRAEIYFVDLGAACHPEPVCDGHRAACRVRTDVGRAAPDGKVTKLPSTNARCGVEEK